MSFGQDTKEGHAREDSLVLVWQELQSVERPWRLAVGAMYGGTWVIGTGMAILAVDISIWLAVTGGTAPATGSVEATPLCGLDVDPCWHRRVTCWSAIEADYRATGDQVLQGLQRAKTAIRTTASARRTIWAPPGISEQQQ